jgi:hypothetical protein
MTVAPWSLCIIFENDRGEDLVMSLDSTLDSTLSSAAGIPSEDFLHCIANDILDVAVRQVIGELEAKIFKEEMTTSCASANTSL